MNFQTRTLYVLGVLTIAAGVVLQVSLTWFMWSFRRINEVPAKEQIDLITGGSQTFQFVPNYRADYNVDFRLSMDRADEDMDRILMGQAFHIEYGIYQGAQKVGHGVISSETMAQVGHGGNVCSIRGKNPRIQLKSNSPYTLLIDVRQGNQVLNAYSPEIVVCTCASLKGSPIPATIRGHVVLWILGAGLCLLGAAGWRQVSHSKRGSHNAMQSDPRSSDR